MGKRPRQCPIVERIGIVFKGVLIEALDQVFKDIGVLGGKIGGLGRVGGKIEQRERAIGRFEDIATPMAAQVLALQRQIQNLRRTRDLLLPRLMSGELAV